MFCFCLKLHQCGLGLTDSLNLGSVRFCFLDANMIIKIEENVHSIDRQASLIPCCRNRLQKQNLEIRGLKHHYKIHLFTGSFRWSPDAEWSRKLSCVAGRILPHRHKMRASESHRHAF